MNSLRHLVDRDDNGAGCIKRSWHTDELLFVGPTRSRKPPQPRDLLPESRRRTRQIPQTLCTQGKDLMMDHAPPPAGLLREADGTPEPGVPGVEPGERPTGVRARVDIDIPRQVTGRSVMETVASDRLPFGDGLDERRYGVAAHTPRPLDHPTTKPLSTKKPTLKPPAIKPPTHNPPANNPLKVAAPRTCGIDVRRLLPTGSLPFTRNEAYLEVYARIAQRTFRASSEAGQARLR